MNLAIEKTTNRYQTLRFELHYTRERNRISGIGASSMASGAWRNHLVFTKQKSSANLAFVQSMYVQFCGKVFDTLDEMCWFSVKWREGALR
jgi:hypothetical protein